MYLYIYIALLVNAHQSEALPVRETQNEGSSLEIPIFLITYATLVSPFCTPSVFFASRAISSANLISPVLSPPSAPSFIPSSVVTVIISRNMLKSNGDRTHPSHQLQSSRS